MALDSVNIAAFSRLIRTLLLEHNRVSLPGIGSFMAENQESDLLDGGRMISAPTRVVTFSVKETWNDEWLERAYAAELDRAMLELEDGEDLTRDQVEESNRQTAKLFSDQAKREVKQFSELVLRQLQYEGAFQFPGFGVMRMGGKKQEITFEKASECNLSPEGFGLESLSIKPLATPSRLIESKTPKVKIKGIKERTDNGKNDGGSSSGRTIKNRTHKSKPDKTFKWIYILLGILLLVIVLFVLAYIFREELRPFLLQILYSSSDRPYVDKMIL